MSAYSGSTCAIVLAGGLGSRMGGELPKQFLDVAGEPMFVHSLRALGAADSVAAIVLVLPPRRPRWVDAASDMAKVVSVADAGASRQQSLANGLVCIPDDAATVLIHDAARCLVRPELIDAVAGAVDGSCEGVIAAIPMEDSVKEVSMEGVVLGKVSRKGMWRAQTPQAMRRGALEEALVAAEARGTEAEDCSELLTSSGAVVKVVQGDPDNFKVTRLRDLALAEQILAARSS